MAAKQKILNLILFLLAPLSLLLVGNREVDCAKIFIFMGAITSHSPTASVQPLADKLAERGHEVTVFTPIEIPTRHPAVINFCPPELYQFYGEFVAKYGTRSAQSRIQKKMDNGSLRQLLFDIFDLSHRMCQLLIHHPDFKEIMDKQQFDLWIVDSGLNECGFPLAHFFGAKTMIYGAVGTIMFWDVETFGLPAELSWLPGLASVYEGGELSFWDRMVNAGLIFTMSAVYRLYHLPKIEQIFRDSNLSPKFRDMPSLAELVQNTSLMLINQHHSHQFPRPYPPFVIPVGGMHVDFGLKGTLPQEMENFIGNDSFIYISFGSYVRVSTMPDEVIQVFFQVLAQSTYKFLWKWEGQCPSNGPSNIYFQPWFPQQDVLTHPKIVAFLTQGGQISIQQGVCHGVPLIICPVDGDQDYNAMRMMGSGNAITLELSELTKAELEGALVNIVNDKSYAKNAKKLAVSCRDRPMSAVDTAVWWTEYVLRTEDTFLLKPLRKYQPLWKYWCLDIWAFVFFIVSTIILGVLGLLKFILLKLYRRLVIKDGPTKRISNDNGGVKFKTS